MLDFARAAPVIGEDVWITPWSFQSLGVPIFGGSLGAATSQAYPAANVGIFVPFGVAAPVIATKMGIANGGTITGTCVYDLGIFNEDGTLVVATGSFNQTGTTTWQEVDITDTLLQRGRYYMGVCCDQTANSLLYRTASAAGICQMLGLLKDASCAPPFATNANPATFVATDVAAIPDIGVKVYRAAI